MVPSYSNRGAQWPTHHPYEPVSVKPLSSFRQRADERRRGFLLGVGRTRDELRVHVCIEFGPKVITGAPCTSALIDARHSYPGRVARLRNGRERRGVQLQELL